MKLTEYNLGSLISIKHGFAFSGNYISQEDNGKVLVTPGNFRIGGGFQEEKCKFYSGQLPDEYTLIPGDFIVTMTDLSKNADTLGYSAFVPNSNRTYLHNQRIGLVTLKSDLCDREYLYWLMRTYNYQRAIANTATGSTVKHTSPTKIYEYKFQAPEKDIQRKIAKSLSAYEDLIDNNRKQIILLEEAAMRLFKEWFVNLRFPGHETTQKVDGVPEGWTRAKTKEFMKFKYGKALKADDRKTGQHPVYGSSGVIGYHNDFLVEGPVIIVGRKGNVGSVYLSFSNAYPIDTVYYIESDISILFSYFNLKIRTFNNNDSAVPGLNRDYAESMEMICPNIDLLNEFDNKASVFLELQNKLRHQINLLQQSRDLLLPKLISGEPEVLYEK